MKGQWTDGVQSDRDLDAALGRVDELLDAEEGTPEAAERNRLFELIEAYEDARYQILPPSLEATVAFRRDQELRSGGPISEDNQA